MRTGFIGLFAEIYSGFESPFFACWRVTFFACTKKVTKEMHPVALALRASLAAVVLLQGRFDAPSGLIKTKMHIPVHFTLAKSLLLGNA
jgi:hypothetical protein